MQGTVPGGRYGERATPWSSELGRVNRCCSATWEVWHWKDRDVSGWVLNVKKETNSRWGDKVGSL